MAHAIVDIADTEGVGPGGAMRRVRAELGVSAFGINQFDLPPGAEGREHDETGSGQEEVYVVIAGGGVLRVGGQEIELRPGRFVLVSPEETRVPVAGPDGLSCVVVGAPADGRYEPPPWG